MDAMKADHSSLVGQSDRRSLFTVRRLHGVLGCLVCLFLDFSAAHAHSKFYDTHLHIISYTSVELVHRHAESVKFR